MTTHRRFDRTARLIGDAGVARLASATVTVLGVGGVGSFAAEALARTGVGRIILVDYDRVCVTNVNRQVHAVKATLGKPKAEVMAERLRQINPDAVVEARGEFYGPATSARLLAPEPDVVIDAIDNLTAKLHLLATCIRDRLRVVSAMGAAARLDPTRVRVADLSATRVDPFAREVRRGLRVKHGLDPSRPPCDGVAGASVGMPERSGVPAGAFGVWAVFSEEPPLAPHALAYDIDGFRCVCPGGTNGVNDCDHGARVDGSAAFVPSVFGVTAASVAVRLLVGAPVVADADRPRRPAVRPSLGPRA